MSELIAGASLGPETFRVRRADLVRYAEASGDHNPIHWSDRVAQAAGLPGVVAHGMYTMALTARAVDSWSGDPTAVVDLSVRFTRPVVVPDDDEGALVEVCGQVKDNDGNRARIDLTVTCEGRRVLGMARATVTTQSTANA